MAWVTQLFLEDASLRGETYAEFYHSFYGRRAELLL